MANKNPKFSAERPRGVCLSWVHPDLRRQIVDEQGKPCSQVEDVLTQRESQLHVHCTSVSQRKSELEEQNHRLKYLLQKNEEQLADVTSAFGVASTILRDTTEQRSMVKDFRTRLRSQRITTADIITQLGITEDATSHKSAETGFSIGPSPLTVDLNFFHLFLSPSLWGNVCFSPKQNIFFEEKTKDASSHDSGRRNLMGNPELPLDDAENAALIWPREMGMIFLGYFFPILSLKDAPKELNMDYLSVDEPVFIAQPCPLETCLNTSPSPLGFSSSSDCCLYDACLYWHEDQLTHLISTYSKKIIEMKLSFCVQEPCLCVVSAYLSQSLSRLRACSSVSDVCTTLVSIASQIIRLGWHIQMVFLIPHKQKKAEMENISKLVKEKKGAETSCSLGTTSQAHCSSWRGWVCPIFPASSTSLLTSSDIGTWCLCHLSDNETNILKRYAVLSIEKQLRDPYEVEVWYTIMNRLQHSESHGLLNNEFEKEDTDAEKHWNGKGALWLLHFALKENISAISWRCTIRILGDSVKRIRWLSARGKQLFPNSPHLCLHYIFSLMLPDATSSSGASNAENSLIRAKSLVDACLEVADCLTHQCEASMCTNSNEISDKLRAETYRAITSRYIAYIFILTLQFVVRLGYECRNHEKQEGSAASVSSLEILEQARLLLQSITAAPGKYFLLPVAFQNFLLLRIELEECISYDIERIDTVLHILPLGAISEQPLALCAHSVGNRNLRLEVLQQQLQLLQKGKPSLHGFVHDELRSAVQLSMLRAFSNANLPMVEQVIRKATMVGEMTATALWMEYLQLVEKKEVSDRDLTVTLLDALQSEQTLGSNEEEDGDNGYGKKLQLLSLFLKWKLESRLYKTEVKMREEEGTVGTPFTLASEFPCRFMPELHTSSPLSKPSRTLKETQMMKASSSTAALQSPIEVVASLILNAAQKSYSELEHILYLQGLVSDSRFCHDPNCVWLLLIALLRRCCFSTASVEIQKKNFEASLTCAITVLHEQHLMWWSSLDIFFNEVIGFSHYAILLVYHLIPALLGPDSRNTEEWRKLVLRVGVAQCGILHPLLRSQ